MSYNEALDGHIFNIVQNNEILEQSDLQGMLKERGYDIPQATLSRRLRKLKIAKVEGVYKVIDLYQTSVPLVLNMQVSDFGTIVMHTHPGNANSLAYFIDQKYVARFSRNSKNSGILGTIAGDDTVLIIFKSKSDLDTFVSVIHQDFPYLSG